MLALAFKLSNPFTFFPLRSAAAIPSRIYGWFRGWLRPRERETTGYEPLRAAQTVVAGEGGGVQSARGGGGGLCSVRSVPSSEFTSWSSTGRGGWGLGVMCSGSEAGSYPRLIDFVYHSTLGLRVIKKTKGRTDLRGSSVRDQRRPPHLQGELID